jgi:phenylacetate-CoA ligase
MNWRGPLLRFADKHIKQNHIHQNLASLREFYALPIERQLQIQEQRLKDLLQHAALHTPFYRDFLREGGVVSSSGEVDLSRFSDIPFLTKAALRNKSAQLKSDDLAARNWHKNTSGGSTGEPVALIQDDVYADFNLATQFLQYEELGLELGRLYMKLWGSERDILQGGIGWRARLANSMRNRIFLNSFRMTEADMARYAFLIQRREPFLIEAYADSIYELAKFINRSGLTVSGVHVIITSAGNLYPFMREEIQKAFHCQVFNRYGTREVGSLALEDRNHSHLRVYPYTHIIEIVNDQGKMCKPDEEGDVVITCLTNYAMPLIRYRIGDRGVPAEIDSHFVMSVQKLKCIAGRVTDSFIKHDGTVVSPYFFIHFLGVVHNSGVIEKTQIIQTDYDTVNVKLVATRTPPIKLLKGIENSIKKVMGMNCQVDFEFVEDIPSLASGKYQYTISLVRNPNKA